jgi:hypothetical protein
MRIWVGRILGKDRASAHAEGRAFLVHSWMLPQRKFGVSAGAFEASQAQLGDVAQLVRALPCHGRGRGFEPRRPRHTFQKT